MLTTPETRFAKTKRLARQIAATIIDDPGFRRFVRETILHVLVEQERQKELGAVRVFFDACDARGIHMSVSPEGRLRATNQERFTADLRAVLMIYREPITRHLEQKRHLEHSAARGASSKGNNGTPGMSGG